MNKLLTRFRAKGYAELTLAMVFVGSSFVVAKVLTDSIPIFLANGLRFIFAGLALLPLIARRKDEMKRVRLPEIKKLLLLALFGVFLFNVFLFLGLQHIAAGTSGIITSFAPVVIAVLSVLLLREGLSRTKAIAVLVATLGLLTINLLPTAGNQKTGFSLLGFALIFGVVLCEAAFTLTAKSVGKKISAEIMTILVVCFSGLMFLPFGIWQAVSYGISNLTIKDWLMIAYLGVVVNALTYFLWYSGLKKATATEAAVFTGIMPISSLVLSAIFLGEGIRPLQIIGLLLILAGVFTITRQPRGVSGSRDTL